MTRALPDRIETARLVLREPRLSDASALFDAYTQDAEVARYTVWTAHQSVTLTRAFMEQCVKAWQQGGEQTYVVALREHEDKGIGAFAARAYAHAVDVGYVLARSHWRKGLMPEALRAVSESALAMPRFFRVQATCDVENVASARALEKAAFIREGKLERFTVHPNISREPRPCFMYARCR